MTPDDSFNRGIPAPFSSRFDFNDLIFEDRVHQSIYTDEAIFREEMRKIFGGVWVYLAHESQIPEKNDYVASKLGLRPIIVVRDLTGRIRALYNRCTHRGATVCRHTQGNAKSFACPYHGWSYFNSGKISGVPWPDGYADDFSDPKYNLAQVPRVQSYRGFIFGTLNPDMPPLEEYLGGVKAPLDDWLDRHPGGTLSFCDANRLKFNGNWKLLYDNSADGYHVIFSHRSLLAMENRFVEKGDEDKGMAYYKSSPDNAPFYVKVFENGHHYKDKRPAVDTSPGGLWSIEGPHPGMEHYEEMIREKLGDKAGAVLDLASSEPVNINIFPNLHILGNHVQVSQPISLTETDTTWWGTAVIDENDDLHGCVDAVNALRMRTQESFPNFGELDDLINFEQIQTGLAGVEDEWVYMHRGLGIPDRIKRDTDGYLIGPPTDEVFLRETMQVYKNLMMNDPNLIIERDIDAVFD
ncbi:MAG: (2Fe-2S)-binding protein [Rhodospirillaceae bacterium]|nr:(2Fe-2S)-binding protein [Rhodospirillaceae bacterium]|tara:strand:- start:7047 stop:8444 length:1398 start_codon:yes stop_codon:yes gene_type:complete